jgi:hypothetical protein
MLAIAYGFSSGDRNYLQSADGTIVPQDRMRPFRRSSFSGTLLQGKVSLPVAWSRRATSLMTVDPACLKPPNTANVQGHRPTAVKEACVRLTKTRTTVRQFVDLTGARVVSPRGVYWQTVDGDWIAEGALFIAREQTPPPGLDRWVHFSIGSGTLTAYHAGRPVFATLASPGIGGQPKSGGDPLADRTTPLGTYRIHFKHRSDDMSPEAGEHRSFWIADVPFTMYFKQPFAIHVAYWHESFGEPMSGGCINVSPEDGRWLFDWTTPTVPPEWYGVSASKEFGRGTTITIER